MVLFAFLLIFFLQIVIILSAYTDRGQYVYIYTFFHNQSAYKYSYNVRGSFSTL